MDKRFLIALVVVVLGLFGLFYFSRDNNPNIGTSSNGQTSNHTEGNNTKHVELLVYGDFECSACEQIFPIEKQAVEKYYNDISFTFRHFALDGTHPNARAAARSAEAAGLQGKFFEMHNLLYQEQNSWVRLSNPYPVFEQMAKTLGLETSKFKTDYASEAVNKTINADYQAGVKQGVDGTPTYFLNGEKLNNQDILSVAKFSVLIDKAIQDSSKSN